MTAPASTTNPMFSLTVDTEAALQMLQRLTTEQIPKFLELYNSTMAMEAKGLLVMFSSSPYINRITGDLAGGIDAFKIPGGYIVGPTVYYAKWVYGGHRNVAWGHDTGRMVRPRPAHLYARTMLIARQPGIAMACAEATLKVGATQ